MRKDGTSKDFLDGIEKAERNNLLASTSLKTDGNGILKEPVRDKWESDLSKETARGENEWKNYFPDQKKPDFPKQDKTYEHKIPPFSTEEKASPNNLLQSEEKYDTMYASDLMDYGKPHNLQKTGATLSEDTKNNQTYVTYGHSDKNVVGGIQLRLNEMNYKGKNGNTIGITGIFDEDTEEGLKQFQKERGLPVTGILDDATKAEMGFAEDYSISRTGKNATPWLQPYSPPFNLDDYNEQQEKIKEEKEPKDSEDSSGWKDFLSAIFLGGLSAYSRGVAQGTDMTYRGELEEAEEGDLVTNHDQDSGREYYYNSMGDKYKQ